MAFCTNCGKEVAESDRFCSNCGFQLKQSEVQEVQQPVVVNAPEPSVQPNVQTPPIGVNIIATPDPVFRTTCSKCSCVFEYRRHNLGRRAWFPNGFVYCPKCRYPIRHRLEYEVKE